MEITKTEYLYGIGVDTSTWADMTYREALEHKIVLAYNRITELNKVHYMSKDSDNINECVKAMGFNEKLLKELP